MASALQKGEAAVEAAFIPATAQSTGFGTYTLEAPNPGHNNSLAPPTSSSNMESTTPTVTNSPTLKATETGSTPSLHHGNALSHTASNEKAAAKSEAGAEEEGEGSGLLTGFKLYAVFSSLMLACFMFALDQSIVATAIPVIVSDFRAFAEVSWVITAYFLTQCGLILLVGQLLTFIKAKWILLAAIFFFELGSLLCAVAQNMPLLIFGRAVQGIGAAGLFVSMLSVIVTVTTLKQRPAFMATFGFVFVISSVVGPLLGGVFTERASWRWCFWINLPIGGIAAAAVVFFLPSREPIKPYPDSPQGWKALKTVDWVGSALVLAMITCLLLALQWGGNNYAWGNWRIILLFVLGGLLVGVFLAWQYYRDQHALIPLSLLRNRTQLGSMGAMAFLMVGMLGGTYQLPLFYQATRGRTPEQSGIDIIPFMLAVCIGIFIQGGYVTKFGRYYYPLLIGSPISAVGFGLLYTMDAHTSNSKLIGFQILAGVGIGISFQNPLLAIQTEYHDRPHLIPQANGVVSFAQLTGAALGIGIVNTVQSVFLNKELGATNTGIDVALVRESPVAIYQLPEDARGPVIDAYVKAITESLIPIIVACGLAWIISFFIKNKSTLGKVKEMAMA